MSDFYWTVLSYYKYNPPLDLLPGRELNGSRDFWDSHEGRNPEALTGVCNTSLWCMGAFSGEATLPLQSFGQVSDLTLQLFLSAEMLSA